MTQIKPHYSNNRSVLADVIPLSAPYSVQVEPSQTCNIKCNYCMQSFIPQKHKALMSMETFKTICSQMSDFDRPIKQLNLAGWGEPLVNPVAPAMIQYAKARKAAQNVAVITNGLLLTRDKIMDVVDSGVDHIRISLQGITKEQYKKVCGKKINFPTFIGNLNFLNRYKRSCIVSVKVADIALAAGEEELFYKMFDGLVDQMYVENIRPMFKENQQDGQMVSKYGVDHPPVIACPLPFFMMSVTATGEILPCCSYYKPLNLGNVAKVTLRDAWDSARMKGLYKMLLSDTRLEQKGYPVCRECLMPDAVITEGDELDDRAEEIRRRFNESD